MHRRLRFFSSTIPMDRSGRDNKLGNALMGEISQ